MFYIYKILQLDINKRVYIGMTKNPKKRFKEHCLKASASKNSIYIHSHGGKDNFKLIIIDFTNDYREAINKEQFWTLFFVKRCTLNNINIGTKSILSDDAKKKISESKKGEKHPYYHKHLSKEHRKKVSISLKEYYKKHPKEKISEEMREKMKLSHKNISKETRNKMRIARLGKHFAPFTKEHKEKLALKHNIPVICVDTNIIYSSAKEAQIKTGISRACICNCCKHKQQTAGGLKWEYYNKKDRK